MSEVSDESHRLDGNAAAGLLAEIFPFEMTSAQSECAGCGQVRALGALMLYGGEMGAVLRCPSCDGVQIRIVRARGRYLLDMRGVTLLQIEAAPQA
jgi:hypothetical protein